MSKTLFSLLAALLVCMVATSAQADQGISSSTLDAMGLSGLTVMSDSDALSIRGMGWKDGKKVKKGYAKAKGSSWASVEFEGEKKEAEAGSENEYSAKGRYKASGENGSEAELEKTYSETLDNGDGSNTITKRFRIEVSAGGYSSAKQF
jgi:hypothetical protein